MGKFAYFFQPVAAASPAFAVIVRRSWRRRLERPAQLGALIVAFVNTSRIKLILIQWRREARAFSLAFGPILRKYSKELIMRFLLAALLLAASVASASADSGGYHPMGADGYHPMGADGYHPLGADGYHPMGADGYHPLGADGYHPLGADGYHPMGADGYHPLGADGYHPLGMNGYHPMGGQ
jgi:hypothetical protein